MSVRRYGRSRLIEGGKALSTTQGPQLIKKWIDEGKLKHREYIIKAGERLDSLAGRFYGDATVWWVIAAASGIGWAMQVPPGTVLKIPNDIARIKALVG